MSTPLPPLAPVSRRIQHHAARMGVARPMGLEARTPERTYLDTERPAPVHLQAEALISPRGLDVRPMERPPEVDDRLGICTPQFFLRNTARITRPEEDRLSFQRVETTIRPEDPHAVVRAALQAAEPLPLTAHGELRKHLAERAEVMYQPWNARYGRPDPT